MLYNVKLETTVEAPSAEAAKQTILAEIDGASGTRIEVVPANEWRVAISFKPHLTFDVTVQAESPEDAEDKAYRLVEDEALYGAGLSGVLELAYDAYELNEVDIDASDAESINDEEEDA